MFSNNGANGGNASSKTRECINRLHSRDFSTVLKCGVCVYVFVYVCVCACVCVCVCVCVLCVSSRVSEGVIQQ